MLDAQFVNGRSHSGMAQQFDGLVIANRARNLRRVLEKAEIAGFFCGDLLSEDVGEAGSPVFQAPVWETSAAFTSATNTSSLMWSAAVPLALNWFCSIGIARTPAP